MKIQKITWLDARELEADTDMLKVISASTNGEEFLVVKETFGEIRELSNVYMITTEKDNLGDETITVIPKSWMVEIE